MARNQVRLKDVAEKAGVAVNTASTILNRRPNSWASKATEERVFAAAKELGYRPNRAAVALQSGKFQTLGLLIADLHNPYFTNFASVLGHEVEKLGYDLVIESWRTDLEREKKLLGEFVQRNVDGLAAFVSDVDSHRDFFEKQAEVGMPVVALAMPGAGDVPVDMVMPNFEAGLRAAAVELFELGHRRFAFLAARSPGQRVGGRPMLFQKVVSELPGCEVEILNCGHSVEDACGVGRELLAREDRPTAVIALNDFTAIGVVRAAKDKGLSVPGDLSVVGIDGIPLGEQLPISLSTVVQPHHDMVAKTVELLIEQIDGKRSEAPRRVEFEATFVRRESIGPVV